MPDRPTGRPTPPASLPSDGSTFSLDDLDRALSHERSPSQDVSASQHASSTRCASAAAGPPADPGPAPSHTAGGALERACFN